jgi:asparaginyl-tRNA synthetase
MVEPEMAFATLDDVMDLAEGMIEYVIGRCVEICGKELSDILERDLSRLQTVTRPFPRLHYEDAVALLHKKGVEFEKGNDFGGGDETVISDSFDKPVFVHHYPTAVKAFYMQPDFDNDEYCLSVDLLAPEGYGEIIGGGQRVHDIELLEQRIREHNLPEEAFKWYTDLRRFGSVPHSGFGLGVERFVSYICGLTHLREAIPFPRLINRLNP